MKTRSRRSNSMSLRNSKRINKNDSFNDHEVDKDDFASLDIHDGDNEVIFSIDEKVDLKSPDNKVEAITPLTSEDVTMISKDVEDDKSENPKKDPDELDISFLLGETDDEGCEDVVTVADDVLNDDVLLEKDEVKNTKKEASNTKKSEDMIIHFFIKTTDTKEEDTEVEAVDLEKGSTKKRSVEDESLITGDNKKQKVEEVPTENDPNFCEIIEDGDSWSSEDYSLVLPYYNNYNQSFEEGESAPVCIDVESEEDKQNVPCRDVDPMLPKSKATDIQSESNHTGILALVDLEKNDQSVDFDYSGENEDPSDYLSDPARKDLERLNELRSWKKTAFGSSLQSGLRRLESGDVPVRILSYSVLSQAVLQSRPQLGRGTGKAWLEWEYRWRGIMREVLTLDPDVVCLQEVQMKKPDHFQLFLLPFFQKYGYEAASKFKTGDDVDGCAIFFKTEKFSLEKKVGVDFYRGEVGVLGKINVGLICRLIPLTGSLGSNSRLVVATTQLHHDQGRADVRLAQTALLLAELDRQSFKSNGQYHPTVMSGNFNLQPFSTVYQLITGGSLTYEGLILLQKTIKRELFLEEVGLTENCMWKEELIRRKQSTQSAANTPGRLSHEFGFRSAYKHKKDKDGTDKQSGSKEVSVLLDEELPQVEKLANVDYMFYNTLPSYVAGKGDRVEGPLKLVARRELPTEEEMISLGGMPSWICPSNHLPLAADFILKTS